MVTRLPSRQEVRGQGTVPAARGQALPDAGDVPQVNARVAADPGVAVPRGAFGGGEGMVAAGEMLGQAAMRLGEAQQRIQRREDAVGIADRTNKANEQLASELRRLNTEEDLSDPAVLESYGKFAEKTMGDLAGSFRGAPEGQAQLQVQFSSLRSRYVDQASVASVQAGRKKVETRIGESLSGLTNIATTDPAQLPALFDSLDATLDIMAPALTPDEEEAFRSTGRAEITLSAVNSLLSRGNAEDAESLIQDVPGVLEILTPAKQRELAGRFETIRREKNEALFAAQRKVQEAEIIAGRKLTVAERMRLAGIDAPEGRQTASDKIRETEVALGRPVTPDERAKLAGLDVERRTAATDAGKLIQDREIFVRQYGAESPQVAMFDEATENQDEPPSLADKSGMRAQFLGLSKDMGAVRDAFLRIETVAADVNKMTAAADVSLIFQFMKMLDPGGRVTEGEIAITGDTTGVPGQVINLYNSVVSGANLNPQQRQSFKDQAQILMLAQMRAHTNMEQQFRGIAERAGIDPGDVVVDFIGDDFRKRFAAPADVGTGGPKQKPRYDVTGKLIGGGAGKETPAEGAQGAQGAAETAVPASAPADGPAPETVPDGAPSEAQGLSDEELLRQLGITPTVGP